MRCSLAVSQVDLEGAPAVELDVAVVATQLVVVEGWDCDGGDTWWGWAAG